MNNIRNIYLKPQSTLIFLLLLIISLSIFPTLRPANGQGDSQTENLPSKNPMLFIQPVEERYSYGGVMSFPTNVNAAFYLRSHNLSGTAIIKLYKATEHNLLNYLVYDEKTNQKEKNFSTADFQKVAEFKKDVTAGYENKVLVALPQNIGKGIWYMTVELGGSEENTFIVKSDIGVVVLEAKDKYIFWAQNAATNKSVTGVKIETYSLFENKSLKTTLTTKDDGTETMPFDATVDIALASKDGDISIIPINLQQINRNYDYKQARNFNGKYAKGFYYLFTDRPIYKHGDTVFFKIIARDRLGEGYVVPKENVTLHIDKYNEKGPLYKKTYSLSELGTADGEYKLPKDIDSGSHTISISLPSSPQRNDYDEATLYFDVEEYRKPEYELSMEVNPKMTVLAGNSVNVFIEGKYFSGQPMSGGNVRYDVSMSDYGGYGYSPILSSGKDAEDIYIPNYQMWGEKVVEGSLTLDQTGNAVFEINPDNFKVKSKKNSIISISASIDNGSGNVSSRFKNLYLYSSDVTVYTGTVNTPQFVTGQEAYVSYFINKNDPEKNVNKVSGNYEVIFHDWVKTNEIDDYGMPEYKEVVKKILKKENQNISADMFENYKISFPTEKAGSYEVKFKTIDENKRINEITSWVWVFAKNSHTISGYNNEQEIKIFTDKTKYAFDDTAKLSFSTPFENGDLLMAYGKNIVLDYKILQVSEHKTSDTLTLLGEKYAPSLGVNAYTLYGKELVTGTKSIMFDTESKRIRIDIRPNKEKYLPKDTVSLDINTTDSQNKGTPSEVAVWAIDKALYEISNQNVDATPFDKYWESNSGSNSWGNYFNVSHSFRNINFYDEGGRGGGGGGGGARSVFKDTAYWNPKVITNSAGKASVSFTLPDNLTTWVVQGVAVAEGTMIGSSDKEIIVTKEIIIRPKLPNMLHVGDRATIYASISNYSDKDRDFEYQLKAKNVKVVNPKGKIKIGSQKTIDASWDIISEKAPDEANFTFSVFATDDKKVSDEIVQKLPIKEAVYVQNESVFGTGSNVYHVTLPDNARFEKSKAEIKLSNDLFSTLGDGVDFIMAYPFFATEEISSRLQGALLIKKYPEYFTKQADKIKDIDKIIAADLLRLRALQNESGGFGYFKQSKENTFLTMYVAITLKKLRIAGIKVDESMLYRVNSFLENDKEFANIGKEAGENKKLSGTEIAKIAMKIWYAENFAEEDFIIDKSKIILWKKALANNSTSFGQAAYWVADSRMNVFGTTTGNTGLVLLALISDDKKTLSRDKITASSRYIMETRQNSHFGNTFATVVSTEALLQAKEYLDFKPAISYEVYLDGSQLASGMYDQKNGAVVIQLPLAKMSQSKNHKIDIRQKGGEGYDILSYDWAFDFDKVKEEKSKLSITRKYINAEDSYKTIGIGDVVNVELDVRASENNDELFGAIVDKLPAGLVPLNTHLKNDSIIGASSKYQGYDYWLQSYDYDADGAKISFSGVKKNGLIYTYQARVVAKGDFSAPPAEVIFTSFPEVKANTPAQRLVIYEKSSLPLDRAVVKTFKSAANNVRLGLLGVYDYVTLPITKLIPKIIVDIISIIIFVTLLITGIRKIYKKRKLNHTKIDLEKIHVE